MSTTDYSHHALGPFQQLLCRHHIVPSIIVTLHTTLLWAAAWRLLLTLLLLLAFVLVLLVLLLLEKKKKKEQGANSRQGQKEWMVWFDLIWCGMSYAAFASTFFPFFCLCCFLALCFSLHFFLCFSSFMEGPEDGRLTPAEYGETQRQSASNFFFLPDRLALEKKNEMHSSWWQGTYLKFPSRFIYHHHLQKLSNKKPTEYTTYVQATVLLLCSTHSV